MLTLSVGTQRQFEIMGKVLHAQSSGSDLDTLQDIGFTMADTSICGVGQMASTAILSALEKCPDVFETTIHEPK